MKEYKIGDTLTGGEALDYLNKNRGNGFVLCGVGCSWIYKMQRDGELICVSEGGIQTGDKVRTLGNWLTFQFTVCSDPSLPEESEYERGLEKLKAFYGTNGGYWQLVEFIEKHFVRKEP